MDPSTLDSESESEHSRDVLVVGLTISVVSVSLFACLWTPENSLPFLFCLYTFFFLRSNHYFDNI